MRNTKNGFCYFDDCPNVAKIIIADENELYQCYLYICDYHIEILRERIKLYVYPEKIGDNNS